MLNVSTSVECESLNIERDKFPMQIEPGNPFMITQDFDVLGKNVSGEDLPFNNSDQSIVIDDKIGSILSTQIDIACNRLKKQPDNVQLINNLGLAYLNIHDFDKAIECFNKALSLNKRSYPVLANLAKAYLIKGNLEQSLNVYKDIESIEPNNVDIKSNIARILLTSGKIDEAYEYLKNYASLNNLSVLNIIATTHLLKKQYDKAIKYYRKALSIKNSPGILNNMGVCYALRKSYKKAYNLFLIAHHINKYAVGTLLNLARCCQEMNLHSSAIKYLHEYLEDGYDDNRVRESLAWSFFSTRDYDNCLKQLFHILKTAKDLNTDIKCNIFSNIGVVYECKKDFSSAEKYFSMCLDQGSSAAFLRNLSNLYLKMNKTKNAKMLLDHGISLYGEDPVLLECLGKYYFEIKEYEEAERIFNKVIDLKPDLIDVYACLSVIEMDVFSRLNDARNILLKGLSYHPDNNALLNNLAYNYLLSNEIGKARRILDRIKVLDPSENIINNATRGLLLIKEDNIQEGSRLYNIAANLASNDKSLEELVLQKKYLELAKYYYDKKDYSKSLDNIKKTFRYKPRYDFFKMQAEQLYHELSNIKQ